MATEYQYVSVPSKLKELLEKMQRTTIGIPTRATNAWLESLGYKSKNDRKLLHVLKFIGFVSDSGVPTDYWKHYRGENYAHVLADAIMEAYKDLFKTYPDADTLDDKTLRNFFATKTTSGDQVIARQVSTFQLLCRQADFSTKYSNSKNSGHASTTASGKGVLPATDVLLQPVVSPVSHPLAKTKKVTPEITFNIQVVLPENASAETYDDIFSSIARHLLSQDD